MDCLYFAKIRIRRGRKYPQFTGIKVFFWSDVRLSLLNRISNSLEKNVDQKAQGKKQLAGGGICTPPPSFSS